MKEPIVPGVLWMRVVLANARQAKRVYTGSMTSGVSIDARFTIGEISYALKSADGAGSSIARSSGTVVLPDSQRLS